VLGLLISAGRVDDDGLFVRSCETLTETRDGRRDQPIMAHRGTADESSESDNVGGLPGMYQGTRPEKLEKSFGKAKRLRYA